MNEKPDAEEKNDIKGFEFEKTDEVKKDEVNSESVGEKIYKFCCEKSKI